MERLLLDLKKQIKKYNSLRHTTLNEPYVV